METLYECGLAVSMSSCGMPVSNMPGMRPAKVKGLQFWAVIRVLLENCKDVKESLNLLEELPIAYNINLCIADTTGNGVLFETLDGEKAYKKLSQQEEKPYLCATNHIVIPEFRIHEPIGMRNSIVRYEKLSHFAQSKPIFEEDEIKSFFLQQYPDGMSTRFYRDWFGSIKTVIMDTIERRYSICWFSCPENGWDDLYIEKKIGGYESEKRLIQEQAQPELFEMIPIP